MPCSPVKKKKMNKTLKTTQVTIRRFVRPMRDTLAAAEQTIDELVSVNKLTNDFVLLNRKSIYVPVDFSGIYQASFEDVIKTEYSNNLCYVAVEFVFETTSQVDLTNLTIPDSEGIVIIESVERLVVDGEPV